MRKCIKPGDGIYRTDTMDVINDWWTDDDAYSWWTDDYADSDADHMKYYKGFKDSDAKIGFAIACRDVEGLLKLLEPGPVDVKFLEDACCNMSAACLGVMLDRCDDVPEKLVDICVRRRDADCLAELVKRARPTDGQIYEMAHVFIKNTFVKLMASMRSHFIDAA